MAQPQRSATAYFAAVVIAIGVLSALNCVWNLWRPYERFEFPLSKILDHTVVVYMLGGSGVSLLLLRRFLTRRDVTKRQVGLDLVGWRPLRRLFGLSLIVLFACGCYHSLHFALPPGYVDAVHGPPRPPDATQPERPVIEVDKPSWADFCFWFVQLSAASLAEMLVFVAIGFCLLERALRQLPGLRFIAPLLAMAVASFSFGIYHYTHARFWWDLIYVPLMPIMVINLLCFVITRNFYITFALHNVFAALGTTLAQYTSPADFAPAVLQQPANLIPTLAAFLLPFLALHWLEWTGDAGSP